MDRLNPLHRQARVELPTSLTGHLSTARSVLSTVSASARRAAGILGFFCCSVAVIATASLIALQVH